MKAKKAIKRLRKAQLLLSSVIKQYTDHRFPKRDLLDSAVTIGRAITFVEANDISSSKAKPAKATNHRQKGRGAINPRTTRRLTQEGRRKLSLAAKERWAAARRKGMTSLAG